MKQCLQLYRKDVKNEGFLRQPFWMLQNNFAKDPKQILDHTIFEKIPDKITSNITTNISIAS